MLISYYNQAQEIAHSMKNIANLKANSPVSIKDLDITRKFIRTGARIADIAREIAYQDYIKEQAEAK